MSTSHTTEYIQLMLIRAVDASSDILHWDAELLWVNRSNTIYYTVALVLPISTVVSGVV